MARRLVAAAEALDSDPELSLAHAEEARRQAGRIAVVREAVGIAAYLAGRYDKALAELRAVKRMSGSVAHLPIMADAERGLGRPDRALELATGPEAAELDTAERVELRIVEAGARRDLGQPAAAVQALEGRELSAIERSGGRRPPEWAARLAYAYADVLAELGRIAEAAEWFGHAAVADIDGETDAADRRAALTGGPPAPPHTGPEQARDTGASDPETDPGSESSGHGERADQQTGPDLRGD